MESPADPYNPFEYKTIDDYVKAAKSGELGEKYQKAAESYIMIPKIKGYYIEEIDFTNEPENELVDSLYWIYLHEDDCDANKSPREIKNHTDDKCAPLRVAISKYRAESKEKDFDPNDILSYKDYYGIANIGKSFDEQKQFRTNNKNYVLDKDSYSDQECSIYRFSYMEDGFVVLIEFVAKKTYLQFNDTTAMKHIDSIMESIELIKYANVN